VTPESHRYRTAAQHYLAGRPAYAPALIRRVVQLCGLDASHRLLDLGCGPGILALAFVPFVRQVVGVDPEPEMLRIAQDEAARAGREIEFRQGSSQDLDASFGTFRAAVIGRAFHWMDRQDALRRLDAVIEPGGAVVLFGDAHPAVPDNRWTAVFDALIDRYAEGDAARTERRSPGWLKHEAVLLESPFSCLERVSVIERRATPLDRFVERALSMSSVSRAVIGSRADELVRELREAMAPFAHGDAVSEVVESQALIARRGPPAV
jgi:SAM-dependent methyltransferase